MTSLDPAEITTLLAPLAEIGGSALAVEDATGAELVAVGPGLIGEERAPIVLQGESVGAVRASSATTARSVAQLISEVLGRRAYLELELESMAGELLGRYEEVTLLYGLARSLGSVFDVPTVSEIALEKAMQVVDARRALVALADEERGALVVTAARGIEDVIGTTLADHGISAEVVATGRTALLHEDEPWRSGDAPERGPGEAMLSVPLLLATPDGEEEAIGAMTLTGRPPGERFTAGDASLAAAVASQLASTIHTSRTVRRLADAEKLHREVEIAAGIQRSLLPDKPPPIAGVQVGARCVPADNVGGDLYDLVVDGEGRLTLLIADVAGHGIGSALMMAMARAITRREIAEGKGPAEVLSATNETLFGDLANAGLFITMFCARYDPDSRSLVYACGGHNPPLLRRGNGEIRELSADGMPAGILPDVEFEELELELGPGDLLLLYTDGVVEARGDDGVQFGEERLQQVVGSVEGAPPEELIVRIFAAVDRHTMGAPAKDDSTLVVLAVDGGLPTAAGPR